MNLTRSARRLVRAMYRKYKSNIEAGEPMDEAFWIGDINKINRDLAQHWIPGDISEICRELDRAGLVEYLYGDDEPQMVAITSAGIAYVEGQPLRVLLGAFDVLTGIGSLIP